MNIINKMYKIIILVGAVLTLISIVVMANLWGSHVYSDRTIEGTKLYTEYELPCKGSGVFDIGDNGLIYVAETPMVMVYEPSGKYLYSMGFIEGTNPMQSLSVIDNEINIYRSRNENVIVFDNKGYVINEYSISNGEINEWGLRPYQKIKEKANGVKYYMGGDGIYKEENGDKNLYFEWSEWQKQYYLFNSLLISSIVVMIISICIKAFMTMYCDRKTMSKGDFKRKWRDPFGVGYSKK